MSSVKPGDDLRQRSEKKSHKQTDEPWKQPVEKEQNPKGVPKPDLEEWQKSSTH